MNTTVQTHTEDVFCNVCWNNGHF